MHIISLLLICLLCLLETRSSPIRLVWQPSSVNGTTSNTWQKNVQSLSSNHFPESLAEETTAVVNETSNHNDSNEELGLTLPRIAVNVNESKSSLSGSAFNNAPRPNSIDNSPVPNRDLERVVSLPSTSNGLQCLERRNVCETICASFSPKTLECQKNVVQCQDICTRFGRMIQGEKSNP